MSNPTPIIDFLRFRELAEEAGAVFDESLYLVLRNGAPALVSKADLGSDTPFLECRTSLGGTRTAKIDSIQITVGGAPIPFDSAQYDALFWSPSAVYKFVMAYYPWTKDPEKLDALLDTYMDDPEAYAMAHVPKSVGKTLTTSVPADGGSEAAGEEEETSSPESADVLVKSSRPPRIEVLARKKDKNASVGTSTSLEWMSARKYLRDRGIS